MNLATTYSTRITDATLRLPECRKVARLLKDGIDSDAWDQAIRCDNLLQVPNPRSAMRLARLLRYRLQALPTAALDLVINGTGEEAAQACFVGVLLNSPLLFDFVDLVLRELHATGSRSVPTSAWSAFLDECAARDPGVAGWSTASRDKLRQVCFRILVEAGCLSDARRRELQTVHIFSGIRDVLADTPAERVLTTLEALS